MYKDDDVLNVLNTNTNNNFNEGGSSDDELRVLNENTENISVKKTNSYGIKTSEKENDAMQAAMVDYNLGVNHTDYNDLNYLRNKNNKTEPIVDDGETESKLIEQSTGQVNTTALLAEDYEASNKINPSALYSDLLGNTAYADLKKACGLSVNESFTDFHNRTHYVPHGFEMEAKLLLAEEKRMKYYMQYANGELSESDFLYQAYGKDLMKESGYDLESKLFWYNRYKNKDFTNPLDSDTFLSDLIANARQIWQAETWYKEETSKNLSETLAGLVTGKRLSQEKFYDVFKTQVDNLKPYFDDSIDKIMTYYKAGSLGSAFSPFIDIDGDGKFDYYYHTDGRLYAVEDSSGTGSSKCKIVYNDDNSVHAVQIKDGFDGPVDSFLEGFRDFWVGLADLGSMVVSLFTGIGDAANGGKYWVDSQQRWEAFKKSTWLLGDEDYVTFDSMDKWKADDWANGIAKGIGQVAGIASFVAITWGIGAAAEGIKTGAKIGTDVGKEVAEEAIKQGVKNVTTESIKTAVGTTLKQKVTEKLVEKFGSEVSETMIKKATQYAIKEFGTQIGANVSKELGQAVLTQLGTSAAKLTVQNALATAGKGFTSVTQAMSKGRSGFVLTTKGAMGSIWGQSLQIGATVAIKDFAVVKGQLEAKNQGLKYLEAVTKGTDNEIHALTDGEIWERALWTAGIDFAITSTLRAQGDFGVTSRWNELTQKLKINDLTDGAREILASGKLSAAVRNATLNITNNMTRSMWIDNIGDILENITTAGAQAAFSNPYAKNAGEWWSTFGQSIANPQSILMNLYIGSRNVLSYGNSKNLADQRKTTFVTTVRLNAEKITGMIPKYIADLENRIDLDSIDKNRKIQVLTKLQQQLGEKQKTFSQNNPNKADSVAEQYNNVFETVLTLDQVFSVEDEKAIDALGITKEEASEIRDAIQLLNSSRKEGEPEYGLVTGMLFNEASKEQAKGVIAVYKELLADVSTKSTRVNGALKDEVSSWKGKLKFLDRAKAKHVNATFKAFIEGEAQRLGVTMSKAQTFDIDDAFVAQRLKTLGYDASEGIAKAAFEKAIQSGIIKTHILNDMSAFENVTFDVVTRADGSGYDVVMLDADRKPIKDTSKYTDNPFFKLITSNNNKEAIQHLIKLGVFTSIANQNETESLYNIIKSGTPLYGFSIDRSAHNKLFSNKEDNYTRDFIVALDTICDLFDPDKSSNMDGYAGIEWSTPLMARVAFKEKNSEGIETDSYLYIIPNLSNTTKYDEINRLQAAQALVYNYFKIYQLAKVPYKSEAEASELQSAIASFAMLCDEKLTLEDIVEMKSILNSKEKRDQYIKDHLPEVCKAILLKADMSKDDNPDGYGRLQLIRLYKDGVLNDDILNDFRNVSEKNSNVGKVAGEILSYKKFVDDTKSIMEVIQRFQSQGKLSNTDFDLIKKYSETMKDPNYKPIVEYLNKDGMIPKYVQSIIDNPEQYIPFFNGLVRSGRRLSQEEYSTILNARKINSEKFKVFVSKLLEDNYSEFISYSNKYIDKAKDYLAKAFYGDALEQKDVKNIFKSMSSDDLKTFILDPNKYITDVLNGTPYRTEGETEVKYMLGDQTYQLNKEYLNEDGSLNTDKMLIDIYSEDAGEVKNALQIKREILKGNTESGKFFRNLLCIAKNDIFGEMPQRFTNPNTGKLVEYVRVKGGKLVVGPDDIELSKLLFENENTKMFIEEYKKPELLDRIINDVNLYDTYIGQGTDLTENKHVVEVNLLTLLPKNLKDAAKKMIESIELKTKSGWEAEKQAEQVYSEMEALFTSNYSTSTSEQFIAYKKLILANVLEGNFIFQYDINDKQSMNKFQTLMYALGYGKDTSKIISGALEVDGVNVKNKAMHEIKTQIVAQKVFSALMGNSPIKFIDSPSAGKDYSNVLMNMFSSNINIDDNTKFQLGYQDGDNFVPFKMYGVSLIGNLDDWEQSEGFASVLFDRAIKAALQGGNFSKIFTTLHRSTSFNGTQNEDSYNTYKVLSIVDAVYDYLTNPKSEYSSKFTRIVCSKGTKTYDDVLKTYSGDDSLWKIQGEYDEKNKCFYVAIDKNITKEQVIDKIVKEGFSLRDLAPIWSNKNTIKVVGPYEDNTISYESIYKKVSDLGFEDLLTPSDFRKFAQATFDDSIKIMSIDEDEYKIFIDDIKDMTLLQIEDYIKNNPDVVNKNYYANMLAYYFKIARGSQKVLQESLAGNEEILPFVNQNTLIELGYLLNSEYKNIVEDNASDDDLNALLTALKTRLTSINQAKVKNDSAEYFTSHTSTGDVEKIIPTIAVDSLTIGGLRKLVNFVKECDDKNAYTLSSNSMLSLENPVLNCFSFLNIEDGMLTVSMEDYIKATIRDREAFHKALNEIIRTKPEGMTDEEISALKTLNKDLLEKDSLITQLKANRGVDERKEEMKTILGIETSTPNEPSIKVNPDQFFLSSGKDYNKKLAAQLVANRSFLKQGQSKFKTISSLGNPEGLDGPLVKFQKNMLLRTLAPTTDKLGSALVYNMQSDEAIGEFFLSSYSWAEFIKRSLFTDDTGKFKNAFKGMSEKDVDEMLYDLAMKANLYSTGTTFAAEYAGALMLVYDEESKSYEIKPIVTSVQREDDDIYRALMFGENNIASLDSPDNKKKVYMFTVKQNTFIDNVSGYDSGFDMFDLNDEAVRKSVVGAAWYNLKHHKYGWYVNDESTIDYQDMFIKYYIDGYKLKASDLRDDFINKVKAAGISDDVAFSMLQTADDIAVDQETSFSEEALNNILTKYGITDGTWRHNKQMENVHDGLLYGINKASISEGTYYSIKNYLDSESDKYTPDQSKSADDIASKILYGNAEDKELGIQQFASRDDIQKLIIQNILFADENINGLSLTILANARNGRTVADVLEEITNAVNSYKQPGFAGKVNPEIYTKEINELFHGLNLMDNGVVTSDILKSLSFDDIKFGKDKALFDSINLRNGTFLRNNKTLSTIIDSFNLMEASKSLRADSKALENTYRDIIFGTGYSNDIRTNYISTVKNARNRTEVKGIFFDLLKLHGLNIGDVNGDIFEEIENADVALKGAIADMSYSAHMFFEDEKLKHEYDEDFLSKGSNDEMEMFLSSGKDNIIKYLKKAGKVRNDFEFTKYNTNELVTLYEGEQGKQIMEHLISNFNFREAEADSNRSKFVNSVLNPLDDYMSKGDETYLNNINKEYLLSTLIRVGGTSATDLVERKQAQQREIGRVIEIAGGISKDLQSYLTDTFFNDSQFKLKALWYMGREQREFHNDINYGELRINPKLFKDAFGLIKPDGSEYVSRTKDSDGDVFYALAWRQPGQQKTVMHNMKIVLDDSVTFAMSRRTARDFFNGDFDGDAYFDAQPDKASMFFGKNTFDILNYGGSIYDDLFKGVNIPATSAEEYAAIENNVRPFFEQEGIITLVNNVVRNQADLDDLYTNFVDYFEAKGYDDKSIENLWDAFGIQYRNTPVSNAHHVFTSSNYLLKNLGNRYSDVLKILDAGNEAYFRGAFLVSDVDATWLGQSSKGQKRHFAPTDKFKKIKDTLYETTIGMSKDSAAFYKQVFAGLSDEDKIIVKQNLINYINKGVEMKFVNPEYAKTMIRDITNKEDLNEFDVLVLGQILQDQKINSKQYDAQMKSVLSANEMQEEKTKRNEKLSGVIDLMKSMGFEGLDEIKTRLQENPYGPESLTYASQIAEKLYDRKLMRSNMYKATGKMLGSDKLLRDFLTKSNVDLVTKDNIKWISHKDLANVHKNVVGLTGDVVVAIQTGGEFTDTIGVYDRSKNGKKNLLVNRLVPHQFNGLTESTKTKLAAYLTSAKGDVDADDIQRIVRDSSFKMHGDQKIIAIINILGQDITRKNLTAEDLSDGFQIIFSDSSSIVDRVKAGTIKLGAATTKNFKGTGAYADVTFDIKKGEVPQFIVSDKIADMAKFSTMTGFKNLGKTVSDGKNTYALVKINNMALLDAMDMKDLSYSERAFDAVSILSGSQGIDASFNVGNMFLSMDEEGNIKYDPTGYWNLMTTVSRYRRPLIQDVNGADIVAYNRIAILLNQLENPETVLTYLSGGNQITIRDFLEELRMASDLGGYYGTSVEQFIFSRLTDSEKKKFYEYIHKPGNVFANVFFSKEMNEALESNVQTSADQTPGYIAGKKEDIFHENQRVTNASEYSTGTDHVRYLEGSAQDYNTHYVSRRSILNALMTEIHKKEGKNYGLNMSLLNSMLESGDIDLEEIWDGNIADGYRPILKYQGQEIDPNTVPERMQDKKDGKMFNINLSTLNEEALSKIGYAKPSLHKHTHNYNDKARTMMDDVNLTEKQNVSKYFSYPAATRIAPFLGDGSDTSIYDGLTGRKNKFIISQGIKKISTEGDDLRLDATLKQNGEYNTAAEASEYLSKLRSIDPKSSALYSDLISHKQTLDSQAMRELNLLSRLNLLQDIHRTEEDSEASKAFINIVSQEQLDEDLGNYKTIEQGTFSTAAWDNLTEQHIVSAIELTSSKNGIDLYNSLMRSAGFKAEDNKDIALGSRTIRISNVINNEAKNVLGDEYVKLVYSTKYNKTLALKLEQYLEAYKLLELHDEFIENETNLRKLYKNNYGSMLNQINSHIDGQGGYDQIKQALQTMYDEDLGLQFMIDDAAKINARILEVAKQQNPCELVSWFNNLDRPNEKRKWLMWDYQNRFDFTNKTIDDILVGSMTKKNKSKLAAFFSRNDDGYIASITIAANKLASKKAIKGLAQYMKDNGWMSNAKLYSAAHELVDKEVMSHFLEQYSDQAKVKKDSDEYELDKETYNRLKYIAIGCGLNPEEYSGNNSFVTLYRMLMNSVADKMAAIGFANQSFESLVEARNSAIGLGTDNVDKSKYQNVIDTYNIAQNTLSTMVAMMVEKHKFKSADDFLIGVYTYAKAKAEGEGYTIVDKYGAKLIVDENSRYSPTFMTMFDMDDAIRDASSGRGLSEEKQKAAIAQMILSGDAYIMKQSVADQLEAKVFTKVKHSRVYNAMKKAKNILTSLIMATPTQLLDRVINFPTFDMGVDATADYHTWAQINAARATVNKFVAIGDNLTEEMIAKDPDMQLFIRYLYASGQMDTFKDASSVRGEKLSSGPIPVLKQYLKAANMMFNMGNAIPRFAYWMNLVKDAELNGYQLDRNRTGVAYHLYDGIREATNDVDETAYKYVDDDNKQLAANLDLQAVEVVAQHNGIEGNMPYAATWINERFNTMFLTFPLALVRWADNRIKSLGFAFTQAMKGQGGWSYLGNQVTSNLITGTLLLLMQMALSTNTQEYIRKKLQKKDEEITKEEEDAASNILFRSGQVKLFGSLLAGEETTTAAHSRGPVAALFDSYIADFIPQFNSNYEGFAKALKDKFMQKTLGHMNFVAKDVIESIPGNKVFQSTSFYEPGDNFWENYARKNVGYALGSANANALFDYYQTADETTDQNFLEKLRNGMEYAFSNKFANTKEAKSEHRNYKKAFSILYEYKNATSKIKADAEYETKDTKYFSNLKSDLKNAMQYMNDADALYRVIQNYVEKGVALSTIKSAINSISLKRQIMSLGDYNSFMNSLSPKDKAIIKSAIAYEDYSYPFLDDIYDDISTQYQREKAKNSNHYIKSVSSILNSMSYNTPKNYKYSYNTSKSYRNYSNYTDFVKQYRNSVAYQNKYKSTLNPMEAYNRARQTQAYGTSKDVWGNETRHYTDGTTYNVRQQGMPFPGGNK